MENYKFKVSMEYQADIEVEADSKKEALQQVNDMVGDGIALRDADLVDFEVVED